MRAMAAGSNCPSPSSGETTGGMTPEKLTMQGSGTVGNRCVWEGVAGVQNMAEIGLESRIFREWSG